MSETGESGRARTDDPLLIGLDMAPCLTGVSPGYIAPQAAYKPRLSAGLYRRRRRGPPGPRCPILAESGWAARRQRAPKEARLRLGRLPASYGCDDLTADRRYRTGRGASVFPLRRYDGEIRTLAIKRGRAIVRSHEWLSIEAIVFDKDIEIHPTSFARVLRVAGSSSGGMSGNSLVVLPNRSTVQTPFLSRVAI